MAVRWKCTVLWDGKVWRWRAIADGYLGLAGTAEDEDTAETVCKAACDRAVQQRVDQGAAAAIRQFEYDTGGGDGVVVG